MRTFGVLYILNCNMIDGGLKLSGYNSQDHVLKVDLTKYVEKHGFVFDVVMNEDATNNEWIY